MGDIPAARYRGRVIGESHEATEAGDSKDPLHPVPSAHVAEGRVLSSPVPRPQPMSDASRLWSFGGRPTDIPNFLGLDNPVTGCQLGSILEASSSWPTAFVRYEMSLTKRGSYSSHVFYHFRMRNSRMSYTHPTKIATPPLVPPRFSRSATFCDERATAEVKMSTSETQQFFLKSLIFYFFILEIGMNVEAHNLICWSRRIFWVPRI